MMPATRTSLPPADPTGAPTGDVVERLAEIGDPLSGLSEGLKAVVGAALDGQGIDSDGALRLAGATVDETLALCRAAALLRDRGRGRDVSFSPKVFIPLTRLCRDFCGYCTFRQSPTEADHLYMTPEEVLEVAVAGQALGCTEALFTLGERPEQRYPEAGEWLKNRGYMTTLDYLREMCGLVLQETGLLPHANPGTMSSREVAGLREVNASMGVMIENVSERLSMPGGPHELAPSKRPAVRMKTLEIAGQQKVAFTTGILIGIGETREERIDSLLAIRDLHRKYGHVQEVIVQNFRAKPRTAMEGHLDATTRDLLWTVAVARLVLGPEANVQVPPNLSFSDYPVYLMAGINDWGGVSPLTIDYVNPEAPWPQIRDLRRRTEELGFRLRPRLPVYPEYVVSGMDYIPDSIRERFRSLSDGEGYVKGGIERYVANAS